MTDLLPDFDVSQRALKNLGTFSTTKMTDGALEAFNRFAVINAIDVPSYPELETLTGHCAKFILSLFHANISDYSAFPTSGSSEAVFLSILLLKHHWKMKQMRESTPNLVMGPTGHIAFKVAAKALDIEVRTVDEKSYIEAIDKNTIALICSLGETYTLTMEEVVKTDALLNQFYKQTGHFIPIHVDAASGGFVAPFRYPDLVWDFQLNHVKAINVSSHKFGLVYPSLGWICIDNAYCLKDLAHEHSYLGKTFNRFVIQFSHSAAQIAAQYHNIMHLGRAGYQTLIDNLYAELMVLIEKMRDYSALSIITPNGVPAIPGVIFTAKMPNQHNLINDLSEHLRQHGWHLPTFTLNHLPNRPSAARIIIRNGFNAALREAFLAEIHSFFQR